MTGVCVYRGPSNLDGSPIRVIVTGLTGRSHNRKTGPMAQVWILVDGMTALQAMHSGDDAAVCGTCPLRGEVQPDGARKGRACYVNIGQAPQAITAADDRDAYPEVDPEDAAHLLDGKTVRLGAYGDPTAAPFRVMWDLVKYAKGWTGYTHQWADVSTAWAGLLMASVESEEDRERAHALGYRTFRVTAPGEPAGDHEVACMATRKRNPIRCADCLACSGTKKGAVAGRVDIVIEAHGSGKKHITA